MAERRQGGAPKACAQRIWRKDETLWGGPGHAGDREPAGLADHRRAACSSTLDDLVAFVEQASRPTGFTDAVLLGMGGSIAGPGGHPARRSATIDGGLRLHVLDSTDPGAVLALERAIDLEKTLFIVSSKSGGTIETLSHYRSTSTSSPAATAPSSSPSPTPAAPLVDLAAERGFRRVFENDPNIGGRYSRAVVLRPGARRR